jgi:HEAT repeat protein
MRAMVTIRVMVASSMVAVTGVEVHELAARGPAPVVAWAQAGLATQAAQAAQADPAETLYREGRDALSRQRWAVAAERFSRIRNEHPSSTHVADSYYWQAFALYREGSRASLQEAQRALSAQAASHPAASTRADAQQLLVRVEAGLAGRGDAQAAAAIAQQAAEPCGGDDDVRIAALSALMNMNEERALPILQEVLRDRDECSADLREHAVFVIAQHMSAGSVDILLDLAHRNPDPDPDVREQAVFWLHQVEGPEALAALQAILEESQDPDLQEQAIFAVSQREGDADAVQLLRAYAERADAPSELREQAIFWIGQSPGAGGAPYLMELYPRLTEPDEKESAIFGIAQTPTAQTRAWLLERARDAAEPLEIREHALYWAGEAGGLTVAELRAFYDGVQDPEMREQVVFVASQSESPEMVDFLMEVATNEPDADLREQAVFWLGQSSDPRVPEFLLSLIRR